MLHLNETALNRDFIDSERDCKSEGPALSWLAAVGWLSGFLQESYAMRASSTQKWWQNQQKPMLVYGYPLLEGPGPLPEGPFDGDDELRTSTGALWAAWWEDSSPPERRADKPPGASPLSAEAAERGLVDVAAGCAWKTRTCGRPWAPSLLWPSRLAIRRALPIAAAAARCWIIRSSSSASPLPKGNCRNNSSNFWEN